MDYKKILKLFFVQLFVFAVVLYVTKDLYVQLSTGIVSLTPERAIQAFVLAVVFSVFGIITFSSHVLLDLEPDTVLNKLNDYNKTKFNPLLVFLYLYILLCLLTIGTLFLDLEGVVSKMGTVQIVLNIVFGITSFFLIRKNFLVVQAIKVVCYLINKPS